jgi:hypothetical protein
MPGMTKQQYPTRVAINHMRHGFFADIAAAVADDVSDPRIHFGHCPFDYAEPLVDRADERECIQTPAGLAINLSEMYI